MSRIRYAGYEIKKLRIKNKNKGLLPLLKMNVVYVRNETPAEGTEAIEWFLMTSEEMASDGAAYEKAGQYIRRWKTGRFHYVLKSGCKTGKPRERSMKRMKALILMHSVISVFILNLTYLARINPELSCEVMFKEAEWKLLYLRGEARYMGKGKIDTKVTEAEIQWLLRDFLTKIRTLPADGEVLYNNAVAAYNFVTKKCEEKLTEDFRKDTTFEKVGKSRRYVSIESVLKLIEKSYQLDWVETGEGAESFVRKIRGVFTV